MILKHLYTGFMLAALTFSATAQEAPPEPKGETPKIAEINAKIEAEPKNGMHYSDRGFCFAALGDKAAAVRDFEKALELGGEEKDRILWSYGWALWNLDDSEGALKQWEARLKLNEDVEDEVPWWMLHPQSMGHWQAGRKTAALKLYDEAVVRNPDRFGGWTNLVAYTSHWSWKEKQAIFTIYDTWNRAYKATDTTGAAGRPEMEPEEDVEPEEPILLGNEAKELQIASWVKGQPVKLADGKGKKIHVVEFWATWCPPCRASIPHLSELQKKYKDQGVEIVGISDEDPDRVKKFVKQMGEKMGYAVALDDGSKTAADYMETFGAGGIPHAFVIDKEGRIVWEGHPMVGLDETLDALVKGTFSLEAVIDGIKKERRLEKLTETYNDRVRRGFRGDETDKLGDELMELAADNPETLNRLAWDLMTDKKIKYRNMKFILRLSEQAAELTEEKQPHVLDTFARALYENGFLEKALAKQRAAVEMETDKRMKKVLKQSLERYEKDWERVQE